MGAAQGGREAEKKDSIWGGALRTEGKVGLRAWEDLENLGKEERKSRQWLICRCYWSSETSASRLLAKGCAG